MNIRLNITAVAWLVISPCLLFSQNLVLNASFEDTIACPALNSVADVLPWFRPTSGTPDAFHSCNNPGMNGAPDNVFGTQNANTGIAYGGFTLYVGLGESREYLSSKLSQPLKAGMDYCVMFSVSLGDGSNIAIDRIGSVFTTDSIWQNDWLHLAYAPDVENAENNIITDKDNWIEIAGSFIAGGGEKYITLGNFYDDPSTNSLTVAGQVFQSYYYIDDVSVYEIDTLPTALAGADITICKGQYALIGSDGINANFIYSWQPASGITDTSSYPQSVSPTQTTSYILTVTDTSLKPYKCRPTITDTVTVEVVECGEVYVPNIFSPNSDGNNDVLFVRGAGITNVEFRIYNRWGELVFETADINTGWDGTFEGKPVNAGVYVYTGSVTFANGNTQEFKGNVVVVR